MKRLLALLILALLLAPPARAAVAFGFSVSPREEVFREDRQHEEGPYREWREHQRRKYYVPVYAYAPVMVTAPAAILPADPTGDRFAALEEKLYRHRQLLQKEEERGAISEMDRDHYLNILAAIEHDAHARSYDHNGTLTEADSAELDYRTDQAGADIETFLAAQ